MSVYSFSTSVKFSVVSGTTSATVNTETAHAHGLGVVPRIWIPFGTKAGDLYQSKVSDSTNIYIKSAVASVSFSALVVYWP